MKPLCREAVSQMAAPAQQIGTIPDDLARMLTENVISL